MKEILTVATLIVCLVSCGAKNSSASAGALYNVFLTLLGKPGDSNISDPGNASGQVLSFSPGESVDLNGGSQGGSATGVVVDPSGNGSASGISVNGNGVPQILFVNNAQGNPIGVDVNGNGTADYYLCAGGGGLITLTTGLNCTGNTVTVYPGLGYDENGDGVVDNPILALIANDFHPPISSIYPPAGLYGGAQTVTVTCADNLAPGNLVYSLDGATPAFSPLAGFVKNPTQTSFAVGAFGEGIYTVQYRCRDLAGNLEGVQSAVYEVNHGLPNVTIDGGANTGYVSAANGAVNSISVFWKSSQSGLFTVRANGTGCSSGGILSNGSVSANASNTLTIPAASLSLGSNSIFICVTAGFTGQGSLTVVRDDTAPTVVSDPPAGNYGNDQSVFLKCNDNSGVSCSVTAYTIDGSTPVIAGSSGAIFAGTEYAISNPTPISVLNGTLNRIIQFVARDRAGNLSSVNTSVYSVNASLPVLTVTSTTPARYANSLVIDDTIAPQVSWVADGNKVNYILKRSNASACSVCEVSGVANCPVGKVRDTSGVLYSTLADCNCNRGFSLIGSNSNASGNLALSGSVAVVSQIDNLNFPLGRSQLLLCVANAAAGFGPQFASSAIDVWKDLEDPQASQITPVVNGHNIKPDPSEIVIEFSEPMKVSATVPLVLKVQFFKGTVWENFTFDFEPVPAWNDAHTVLTFRLPWVRFPENAFLKWEIDPASLTDVADHPVQSNDAGGKLAAAFLTGSYFGTRDAAFKTSVAKTGQTLCYTQTGSNPSSCLNNSAVLFGTPRRGQDAHFQFGVNHLNKTILATHEDFPLDTSTQDNRTTLIWQTNYDTTRKSFQNALQTCSGLNRKNQEVTSAGIVYHGYANRTDWRLPSVEELETIAAYDGISLLAFDSSCSQVGGQRDFWSSSFFTSNLNNAWYVDFCEKNVFYNSLSVTKRVRCVSGNVPSLAP
ncbi:DUF1566 domain-containing protein [Leptospira sp. WS92.C1]